MSVTTLSQHVEKSDTSWMKEEIFNAVAIYALQGVTADLLAL